MATVTIGTNDYDAYVSLEDAEAYLDAQIAATTWQASTDDDQKGRAIVSATRFIDRLEWQGEKSDPYQEHQFPRTGLTYADGSEVPSDAVPQQVLDATCELAALMIDGTDVQNVSNPAEQQIQALRAGSASISYFRSDAMVGQRLPQIVQELLGRWLLSATARNVITATGTDGEDAFEDDRFGLNGAV